VRSLRVAPIVEGHGEVQAIRVLLQRVGIELLGGAHVDVLPPLRRPRSKLVSGSELERAVELMAAKLSVARPKLEVNLLLLMVDSDDDAPCLLAPRLLGQMRRSGVNASCVLPSPEYETWFVGAAESLTQHLTLGGHISTDPERERLGKGWIAQRFKRAKYSETVDQPAMTAHMDLHLCRSRCPSFDKLCRDLESQRGGG
jgi:hypothetical protein